MSKRGVTAIKTSTIKTVLYKFYRDFNVESCKDIKFVDDFRKCIDDIYKLIQSKVLPITQSENYECIEDCITIIYSTMKVLTEFENSYNMIIRAYTTAGDSEFDKEDKNIPKIVKRIVRHLEISDDITIYHLIRFALVKNLTQRLVNCLLTKCGISKTEKLVKEFLEVITRHGTDNEYVMFVVEKIMNWLDKIKKSITVQSS